jgi:hypothetical protein
MLHDPYAAHAASSIPPGRIGQLGGSDSNRHA